MLNFQITLYNKNTEEFFLTSINIDLNWVIACVSSNEIKKNSIKLFLDKTKISGEPIKKFQSDKYDLILTQTTLMSILKTNFNFFSLGKRLIINKAYAPVLIYNNYKIIIDDLSLETPKWSKKRIIRTINSS